MRDLAATMAKFQRKLVYSWQPFFARFGRLTAVQIETIPLIMQGHNVLVSAPTASGKTEAVVAPVAERHRQEKWSDMSVVYVTPTRALGNDLEMRLVGPLREMYLDAVLKHGERPSLPTRAIDWLITTPESLDSLICRRTDLFANLRAVIVDEIHLLDGTYRGDQLRVLLERLRRVTTAPSLHVHLLSATLADPDAVAQRYVETYKKVIVSGARPIHSHLHQTHDEIWQLAQSKGWRKILYFCNTRRCVEATAAQLKTLWHPYPVVAHHGSLDRREREEAEQVMKQNSVAVCVATSTLEIGIDIGDIDLVVLTEPPWSQEALLQRIGRGNRRQGVIQAAGLYQTDDERVLLTVMFDAAAQGSYMGRTYQADRSVIAQQTLSVLFQHRTGIRASQLFELLTPLGTLHEIEDIVDYVAEKGYCVRQGDTLYPSAELLDLGEKGTIHSNIPDQNEHVVIDSSTGTEIGRIRGAFDQVFLLAGRSWQVISIQEHKVHVRRHQQQAGSAAFSIRRNVGQFNHLVPPHLRAR